MQLGARRADPVLDLPCVARSVYFHPVVAVVAAAVVAAAVIVRPLAACRAALRSDVKREAMPKEREHDCLNAEVADLRGMRDSRQCRIAVCRPALIHARAGPSAVGAVRLPVEGGGLGGRRLSGRGRCLLRGAKHLQQRRAEGAELVHQGGLAVQAVGQRLRLC